MWNPIEKPYRVRFVRRSTAYGMHGWDDSTTTVATKEEALALMNAPMKSGVYKVQVDFAKNAATWTKNGRWQKVGQRSR